MSITTRFWKWWGSHLRYKLLMLSLTTTLISLTILGYLSLRVGQTAVQQLVHQHNLQIARFTAQDISAHFDTIWGTVRLVTHQLGTSQAVLALQARTMLELRRASPLTYRALYLLDDQGHVLLHLEDDLSDLLNIEDEQEIVNRAPVALPEQMSDAYAHAQAGALYLSPVYIVGVDQTPVIAMSIPLISDTNASRQVVVAEIDLRDIWKRIDEVHLGQTGRAYLVSNDGVIIAHPFRPYIGQAIAQEMKATIAGYEGYTHYMDRLNRQEMLAAYSPVSQQTGWSVVVEQEYDEATAAINTIAFVTMGVLLVSLILAAALTRQTALTITRPIQRLADATRHIARSGDLSQEIEVEGHNEVGQLAETFNQMIKGLRTAQTRSLQTQAIKQELYIAQQIQISLLPPPNISVPGLEAAAQCLPAREVGGDFYDYLHLSPGSQDLTGDFAIAVGDVSGKGISASLYMAVASSALAAKAPFVSNVAKLYQELNALLYPRMAANLMNTALLYARFSQQANGCQARIVNAGLIAPLLLHKGECHYLDIRGLPLGAMPDPVYQESVVELESGDWLVLCSDGIVEAMNAQGEMYSFERLRQCVADFYAGSASDLTKWILGDVQIFLDGVEAHDDITIVAVYVTGEK